MPLGASVHQFVAVHYFFPPFLPPSLPFPTLPVWQGVACACVSECPAKDLPLLYLSPVPPRLSVRVPSGSFRIGLLSQGQCAAMRGLKP